MADTDSNEDVPALRRSLVRLADFATPEELQDLQTAHAELWRLVEAVRERDKYMTAWAECREAADEEADLADEMRRERDRETELRREAECEARYRLGEWEDAVARIDQLRGVLRAVEQAWTCASENCTESFACDHTPRCDEAARAALVEGGAAVVSAEKREVALSEIADAYQFEAMEAKALVVRLEEALRTIEQEAADARAAYEACPSGYGYEWERGLAEGWGGAAAIAREALAGSATTT